MKPNRMEGDSDSPSENGFLGPLPSRRRVRDEKRVSRPLVWWPLWVLKR